MKRKWLFITGIIILLVIAGWMYYQYQKPRADVNTITATYFVLAEKIYQDFVTNEALANQKYVGKVLEITGAVSEAQVTDGAAMVLLAAGDEAGGVNCSFQKTTVIMPVKGQTITIKGRCTGFLMDVNLSEAVIVK